MITSPNAWPAGWFHGLQVASDALSGAKLC
jgi:hypothetical protein